MANETAVWVYAVQRGGESGRTPAGVGGEATRRVTAAGLTAVVGTVPLDRFGADALQRNLNDFEWLAATADAHNAVIEAVADGRAVIPVRLAVLCADDEGVRKLLAERRADLDRALSLVEGRIELGVKVFQAQSAAESRMPRATSGAEYLKLRRDALYRDRIEREAADVAAAELYRGLCPYSVAARRRPVTDRALTGRDTPMLLNAAYLVDHGRVGEFRTAANRLAEHPLLLVEQTGPWLPYSFVGSAGDIR
ncbi:GvpL/GvpF family gas vesicle protein [Nocardia inohanensis]|uniref:GvpL/GvpF family gas vesicle protein n=1 Tax=Nocardia inohanensis TaxID=209246 RepID=UPI00082FABAB|nr:GvpL/GvpF family gas vesicle protein [Nocardia inohanensis]